MIETILKLFALLLPILAACVVMAAISDYIVEPWLRRRDRRIAAAAKIQGGGA